VSFNIEGRRIIDLTAELIPRKTERRLEIRPFIYKEDNTIMHDIDTMSHVGTHVEGPSHYRKEWKDISRIPVESFIGEAVFANLTDVKPSQAISPDDITRTGVEIKKGDIVLMRSPYSGKKCPYIAPETARWLRDKGIKMLGIDETVELEAPQSMVSHDVLLGNDIPIIEFIENMEKIQKKRFMLIALPLRVVGLDSSPIRAIAVE